MLEEKVNLTIKEQLREVAKIAIPGSSTYYARQELKDMGIDSKELIRNSGVRGFINEYIPSATYDLGKLAIWYFLLS